MGLRLLALGRDKRPHQCIGQVRQERTADRGRQNRQPRPDTDIHCDPMVALLHRNDHRTNLAPDRDRHGLIDQVSQCRQRAAYFGHRTDAPQADEPIATDAGPI